MSKPGPCECGAPVTYHASYGAYQSSTSWKCGASHEYDGPGNPCPNQVKLEPAPYAERVRKEREESLRPDREKIAVWAEHAMQAFPMIPEIADYELNARIRDTFANLKHELMLLQKAMA